MSRYDYQFTCHDAKGEGRGDPGLNVMMTLISYNSLEVSPNKYSHMYDNTTLIAYNMGNFVAKF